jgi:hypothetical protein
MEVINVLTVAKNVTVMSFVPFGTVKKSSLTALKKGLRSLRDSSTMGAKEPLVEPMMVCQKFNLSPRLAKAYTSRYGPPPGTLTLVVRLLTPPE